MTKIKRGIIYLLIMIVLFSSVFFMTLKVLEPKVPDIVNWEKYMVKSGDTLWSITPYKEGYDIRDLIDCIQNHNNIDAMIFPGDIIEIPMWED